MAAAHPAGPDPIITTGSATTAPTLEEPRTAPPRRGDLRQSWFLIFGDWGGNSSLRAAETPAGRATKRVQGPLGSQPVDVAARTLGAAHKASGPPAELGLTIVGQYQPTVSQPQLSGQGLLICRLQKLQVIHFVPIDQAGAPIGHRVFPRGFSRLVRLGSAASRRSTTAGAGGAG